jgi:TRAP transporter TAXI family solute receptor
MRGVTKPIMSMLCLFAMLTLLLGPGLNPVAAETKSLRLAANAVGSIMYAFSGGISQVVEKHSGLKLELLPQGNVTAFPMFPSEECDLVMAAADEIDAAYFGKLIYGRITGGKGVDLKVLMLGTRIPAGLLVAGDSGIKSCPDLKGKKVTLDFGTHYALRMGSRAALYGCGLSEKDVTVVKATLIPDALRKVLEGKADACYGSIGVPVFRELEAARGARHIGIEDTPEHWKKIHGIYPGYFPMTIKPSKAAFSVKDAPITLVSRHFAIVSRSTLDDDTAYTFTKTLWEHDAELAPFHPRLKDWVKKHFASKRSPAPYHPGAIRFYKEVGAWTPELEAHNQKLLAAKK